MDRAEEIAREAHVEAFPSFMPWESSGGHQYHRGMIAAARRGIAAGIAEQAAKVEDMRRTLEWYATPGPLFDRERELYNGNRAARCLARNFPKPPTLREAAIAVRASAVLSAIPDAEYVSVRTADFNALRDALERGES